MLGDLVSKSLIVAAEDKHTGEIRYSFLEPLRQFAEGCLFKNTYEAHPNSAAIIVGTFAYRMFHRRCEYYIQLAERCAPLCFFTMLPMPWPSLSRNIPTSGHPFSGARMRESPILFFGLRLPSGLSGPYADTTPMGGAGLSGFYRIMINPAMPIEH